MQRRHRLRSSRDVRRVLKDGLALSRPEFVLYHLGRGEHGPPRLGVVAARTLGTAVVRNRAKRLVREAARPLMPRLRPCDLVVLAKPGALDAGVDGLRRALEESVARAGLLQAAEATR